MVCAECGESTCVKDVKKFPDEIIRKRVCKSCGYIFFTVESDMDYNTGKQMVNQRYLPKAKGE